jgi:hypothetical protein
MLILIVLQLKNSVFCGACVCGVGEGNVRRHVFHPRRQNASRPPLEEPRVLLSRLNLVSFEPRPLRARQRAAHIPLFMTLVWPQIRPQPRAEEAKSLSLSTIALLPFNSPYT